VELPNTHAHIYRDTHTHAHTKTNHKKNRGEKRRRNDNQRITVTRFERIKDFTLRVPNKTTTLFLYEY